MTARQSPGKKGVKACTIGCDPFLGEYFFRRDDKIGVKKHEKWRAILVFSRPNPDLLEHLEVPQSLVLNRE